MRAPRHLGAALFGAALLLTAASAFADDVIHLKNGGKIRGTVIEESPTAGVRIKLADGRIRVFKPEEVFRVDYEEEAQAAPPAEPGPPAPPTAPPAPPPPVAPPPPPEVREGELAVTSKDPGVISIDGTVAGRPPIERSLPEGKHKVRIDFDAGGSESVNAEVAKGAPVQIELEMSEAWRTFIAHRKGVRFGLSLGPQFTYLQSTRHLNFGPEEAKALGYVGGRGTLFVNIGIAPVLDLRLGVFGAAMQGAWGGYSPIGGLAMVRLNLGSVYTLSVGVNGGFALATEVYSQSYEGLDYGNTDPSQLQRAAPGGFFGPRWSVLGLRLGSKRQIEIEVSQSVGVAGEGIWYDNALTLTYLLLPDAAPQPAKEARR